MVDHERRGFLRNTAWAAAALASGQFLPPLIQRALAVEPARVTGTLKDVEHIVIFMQENRSFDHYFGMLRGVRGFGDPRPLRLPGGDPVWHQPLRAGTQDYLLPFHMDSRHSSAQTMHDLNHDWKGSQTTWQNWDAWVARKTAATMGYFQREDLPFHYALADAFTVCDGYHASLFGPTDPNRMFLFTGSSGLGVGDDGKQAVGNEDDGNWTADMARDKADFPGYAWTTYAQRLQQAGIDWRVYQEYDNYGDNALAYFAAFRNLAPDSPLYRRGRAWVPGSTAANAEASRGEHLVAEFARDVNGGRLPQVSWLVAPYIMSEHPRATPAYGASLIARLLGVLAARPEVWSKTVFLLNYDENDGFFDHVPPPVPALDAAQGYSMIDTRGENYHGVPVGLGPRVPMLVISPWSRGGWVNSQVFDHTSVLRLLEARFGVQEPNISPWRRAVAGDLTSCLDFSGSTHAWPDLPGTAPEVALADANKALPEPRPPAVQAQPRQEPGQRPACALPYDFDVQAEMRRERGLSLAMHNRGSVAVSLNAYARDAGIAPRNYTLAAQSRLAQEWPLAEAADGHYGVAVYGPNGFLREFAGSAGGGATLRLEVAMRHDAEARRLLLQLRNPGAASCRCRIVDRYDPARGLELEISPGSMQTRAWDLAAQDHWYDLAVTCAQDARYLRRLAGHIETGRASRSDPAMARVNA